MKHIIHTNGLEFLCLLHTADGKVIGPRSASRLEFVPTEDGFELIVRFLFVNTTDAPWPVTEVVVIMGGNTCRGARTDIVDPHTSYEVTRTLRTNDIKENDEGPGETPVRTPSLLRRLRGALGSGKTDVPLGEDALRGTDN